MKKSLLLLCFLTIGCSDKSSRIINSANKLSKKEPQKALKILDKALNDEMNPKEKLKYISTIENIVKEKVKKADYYKAILQKKLIYLESESEKNKTILIIAKLLIQNYKDNVGALNFLEKVKVDLLNEEEREQYFKSVLIAHINNKNYEQALIETNGFLNRKDLSPSERFRIQVLKARTYTDFKKAELAEKEYTRLLNRYPNLSKKWKIRTQLALTLEGQKKYKEAIAQLKLYSAEDEGKDPLLSWRIEELTKRMAQQPGGKGRLRR
ncbi:MAG: tetratricopeptide repeat protein [Bdellovibrionales bacterium]